MKHDFDSSWTKFYKVMATEEKIVVRTPLLIFNLVLVWIIELSFSKNIFHFI